MNMIRPIETEYNGYRFRSRLEARWAVFFDELGVPYEYESEGFDLGDGIRYLPDFWLPEQECWVEIKPPREWGFHPECDLLAEQTDCRFLLYITGNPWPGEYGIAPYPHQYIDSDHPSWFALGRKDDHELWICDRTGRAICLNPLDLEDERYPTENAPRLMGAYRAARRARFEFGSSRRYAKGRWSS